MTDGTKLGRYTILKPLAQGGMADLLLARADGISGFERHVVIKCIRDEEATDEKFVQMFLTEAKLAATLHHSNIVQVHDVGEDAGRHYFAMEYIHGEDLRKFLRAHKERDQQVPVQHVLAIAIAIASALHHAHEQRGTDRKPLNIVHRDVTPANIIVGYDGGVKLLDFGIAKAELTQKTQVGQRKGKTAYMSPEQCQGALLDRRSDVFSLGIVLYELATVRRLFKGPSDFVTMSTIVNGVVPPPTQARPDLPPQLERIILKALTRDRTKRYQTAEHMRSEMDALAKQFGGASMSSLAEYMRSMFGTPAEPWLVEGPRDVPSFDFDGAGNGLAAAPANAPVAVANKEAPLSRARDDAPAAAAGAASPDPAPTASPAPAAVPVATRAVVSSPAAAWASAKSIPSVVTPPKGVPIADSAAIASPVTPARGVASRTIPPKTAAKPEAVTPVAPVTTAPTPAAAPVAPTPAPVRAAAIEVPAEATVVSPIATPVALVGDNPWDADPSKDPSVSKPGNTLELAIGEVEVAGDDDPADADADAATVVTAPEPKTLAVGDSTAIVQPLPAPPPTVVDAAAFPDERSVAVPAEPRPKMSKKALAIGLGGAGALALVLAVVIGTRGGKDVEPKHPVAQPEAKREVAPETKPAPEPETKPEPTPEPPPEQVKAPEPEPEPVAKTPEPTPEPTKEPTREPAPEPPPKQVAKAPTRPVQKKVTAPATKRGITPTVTKRPTTTSTTPKDPKWDPNSLFLKKPK